MFDHLREKWVRIKTEVYRNLNYTGGCASPHNTSY